MPSNLLRYALVLGLLTAIGPAAIDMYLPALPALARGLHADTTVAQASLMSFYLALGAGQLVAGPLSDRFGRRPPVFFGLALFFVASIGCALADDMGTLVAFRLLQGLGACASTVTPRAVVRDLHTGPEAARLMALLLNVYTVSPILAPLAGSLVSDAVGWRGVFWVLAGVAGAAAVLVAVMLPESRPATAARAGGVGHALRNYGVLLRDPRFLAPAALASFSLAGFFVFVANSAFVFTTHYGVSPRTYALLFAVNAVAFIVFSHFSARITQRLGLQRSVRFAVSAQLLLVGLLLAMLLAGVDRLGPLVALLALAFGLNNLVVPSCFVLAMEGHPERAGSASALIGTFNFAGGAVAMALAAPFADGTPVAMVAAIAACAAVVLVLALRTAGARHAAAVGAA
jgi:DHA1 family bicyclomycin/chloramphenicol resistance-like MFS transporter